MSDGGVSATPDRFGDSLRSLTDGARLTMAQQWNSIIAAGQDEAYTGLHRAESKKRSFILDLMWSGSRATFVSEDDGLS